MNKSLVLVMCDVLILSAMSLSDGGFSDASTGGSGEPSPDGVVTNMPPAPIDPPATNQPPISPGGVVTNMPPGPIDPPATNQPPDEKGLSVEVTELTNKIAQLTAELKKVQREHEGAKAKLKAIVGKYANATNDLACATNRLQQYVSREREQQERRKRIEGCSYELFFSADGGGNMKRFAPVVEIDGEKYVVFYDADDLVSKKRYSSIGVIRGTTNNLCRCRELFTLKGKDYKGVYLASLPKLKDENIEDQLKQSTLKIGKGEHVERDSRYLFGGDSGKVDLFDAPSLDALEFRKQCKVGDLLVSERNCMVIGVVTKKWYSGFSDLKGFVGFGEISKASLVRNKLLHE